MFVLSGHVAATSGERSPHATAAGDELAERRTQRQQRAHQERAARARDPRRGGAGARHALPVPRLSAPPGPTRAQVTTPRRSTSYCLY